MISVAQAQETIRRHARPLGPEAIPLGQAHGRILREAIHAPGDVPLFDRSAMDGYVVRADDDAQEWRVVGEIRAGQIVDAELQRGEAMRIFTGARLPGSGLKVIMQEDVEAGAELIRLKRRSDELHVRRRGEDARAGEILLETGIRLNASAIALLASAGKVFVPVSRVPRILHLTTGDEIVPPEQTPGVGQIRNSNAFLISALVHEWGGEVTHFHAPDRLETMIGILVRAEPKTFDLILISGGSGAGSYDFTAKLFDSLGAEIHFRQVDVRPGKPLIFGGVDGQMIFGLPGNAMSHFVCFHLFVRTALADLLGRTPAEISSAIVAETVEDTLNSRETWWPVRTIFREGRVEARALPWKSSGDITRLPGADALIRIPSQTPLLPAGTAVEYLSLRGDL